MASLTLAGKQEVPGPPPLQTVPVETRKPKRIGAPVAEKLGARAVFSKLAHEEALVKFQASVWNAALFGVACRVLPSTEKVNPDCKMTGR